jgi:nucleoside-diphosphate-sugar epimerase
MAFDIKRLMVTGANGFVGRALCAEASARGIEVLGAIRHQGQLPVGVESIAVGDIDVNTDWQNVLVGCDVVIHLAARVHVMQEYSEDPLAEFRRINVAGTERLARSAAAAGVKRLVYVSSVKVNGEETALGRVYAEQDAPGPQDPYGISKWEAEQALHRVAKETGLEVVIVRPPLVYGAGVKGNFAQMISVLKRGVPLPFALVRNKRSLIYVGNLVDVLILCATHPAAAGQTYLVSDGEDISTPDLLRKLGSAMSKKSRLFSCPIAFLNLAGSLVGKSDQVARLLGSLQVDSNKIHRELDWVPPYSLQQGLDKTVGVVGDAESSSG